MKGVQWLSDDGVEGIFEAYDTALTVIVNSQVSGIIVEHAVARAETQEVTRTMSEGPFEVIKEEANQVGLYDYKHESTLKNVQVSRCRLYLYRNTTEFISFGDVGWNQV